MASTTRGATSFLPDNRYKANTWQGEFPWRNSVGDGYEGTSPVGVFNPNGYGLYDMIGNVWEWTTDWYEAGTSGKDGVILHPAQPARGARRRELRSVSTGRADSP